MSAFKKGDRVRLKPNEAYPMVTKGKIYELKSVADAGTHKLVYIINDEGDRIGVFAYRFELADDSVAVQITGTVKSRSNGVVTLDTEHGAVVLPEAFAPAVATQGQRELLAKFARSTNRSSLASAIMSGQYDPQILELLDATR